MPIQFQFATPKQRTYAIEMAIKHCETCEVQDSTRRTHATEIANIAKHVKFKTQDT